MTIYCYWYFNQSKVEQDGERTICILYNYTYLVFVYICLKDNKIHSHHETRHTKYNPKVCDLPRCTTLWCQTGTLRGEPRCRRRGHRWRAGWPPPPPPPPHSTLPPSCASCRCPSGRMPALSRCSLEVGGGGRVNSRGGHSKQQGEGEGGVNSREGGGTLNSRGRGGVNSRGGTLKSRGRHSKQQKEGEAL